MQKIEQSYKEKIVSSLISLFGKENISAIILYGSRLTDVYRPDSDWDVCVIVDNNYLSFDSACVVDDMVIEYHLISKIELYSLTAKEIAMNPDRFWCSFLKNNEILFSGSYDADDIKVIIKNLGEELSLETSKDRERRSSNASRIRATEWLKRYAGIFNDDINIKLYVYYNLVGAIRIFDSVSKPYDKIPTFKFFELKENEDKRKSYCIERFPNSDYVNMLITAIESPNMDTPFIKKFSTQVPENELEQDTIDYNDFDVQKKIMIIDRAIENTRRAKGSFYFKFYYYMLLEKIRILYLQINHRPTSILEYDFYEQASFYSKFLDLIRNIDIDRLALEFHTNFKVDDSGLENSSGAYIKSKRDNRNSFY